MKLSVIVPAYNEEKNIKIFYEEFIKIFDKKIAEYEIIFVDDGSLDGTLEEIKKLNKTDKNVKAISFSRNFGKEAAMYAGLKESKGDIISFMDADMQQRPETLLEMMNILLENLQYDIVVACQKNRREGKVLSFFKDAFYKIINLVTNMEFKQGASDFRIIRRNVADSILEMKEYFRFSKGIFSWIGFNTYYMEYNAEKRANGNTKWSFIKLLKYAFMGIMSFTIMPLKIPIFIGMLLFILAIVMLVVSINNPSTLNILITFCSTLFSLQFIFIGVIGEYLGLSYIEDKKRPDYIVKERI